MPRGTDPILIVGLRDAEITNVTTQIRRDHHPLGGTKSGTEQANREACSDGIVWLGTFNVF